MQRRDEGQDTFAFSEEVGVGSQLAVGRVKSVPVRVGGQKKKHLGARRML